MVDTQSEKIRKSLREAKALLGDVVGRIDRSLPGDRLAALKLQEAYGIVAVLLQELETGNWVGRVIVPSPYRSS